ncbi:uncharacterized protein LOC119093492 [Pollicipes pollicipes]|uniref:uncharacterized protein LOC119093492 n=1 Tax=Pollicipes pollicipes TaxID=41117 RepID=UPI0018856E05|nr:uncharacterized protein LOC119093492 [Pollicipes pollicipes]
MARQWTVMAALVALCALPATSGWLLEGLVASWVVPDVQAGDRNRVQPKRTQPLQLPEEKEQEPMEFVPPRPHPATEPPERKPHRTPPGADDKATPTVRDIEATAQLYRLLKDRRRSDRQCLG